MSMKKRLGSNLLRLTALIAPALGRTEWAAMKHVAGHAGVLERIRRGRGFSVDTYDEVVQKFSNQWPSGLIWPADIERPDPQMTASQDAYANAAE